MSPRVDKARVTCCAEMHKKCSKFPRWQKTQIWLTLCVKRSRGFSDRQPERNSMRNKLNPNLLAGGWSSLSNLNSS